MGRDDITEFDGKTYQLIIKSRSLSYLASKQCCFRNCKIIRIKLDGNTTEERTSVPYDIPTIKFRCNKVRSEKIRFNGSIMDENGIDLLKAYTEIKKLNPSTLYIIEMDVKTDDGIILQFTSRQMRMAAVLEKIDRSMDTKETPLVLNHIYDPESLTRIRTEHIGRKLSFILVGEKANKEMTVYRVLE